MLAYLIRRVLLAIPVLFAVSFVSFWVIAGSINPLWPLLLGQQYATAEEIAQRVHLDEPVIERYWLWLKGMFTGGGYGRTILGDQPVWPPVWNALGNTVELLAASMVVVVVFSLTIGTIAAKRPGSLVDGILRLFAYLTWSVPAFVLAFGLQEVFVRLNASYGVDPFYVVSAPDLGAGSELLSPLEWIRHMALPIVAVALTFIGAYSRYVRSSMLVSLNAPYTVTARAKGLSERRVTIRHALRTSLIPFVSVLSLDFGSVFATTLVADVVFRLGGLGSLLIAALDPGDPFLLEALVTVTAIVVIAFSLLADVVYAWLDPRIRLGGQDGS